MRASTRQRKFSLCCFPVSNAGEQQFCLSMFQEKTDGWHNHQFTRAWPFVPWRLPWCIREALARNSQTRPPHTFRLYYRLRWTVQLRSFPSIWRGHEPCVSSSTWAVGKLLSVSIREWGERIFLFFILNIGNTKVGLNKPLYQAVLRPDIDW